MDDSVQNLTFYAPIEKADDDQRMVYGYASTETVDSQGEIVKKDALADALDDYMKWANIREMHQPSAVGKTKKAQIDSKGLYIAAKVIDDNAWKKVKEGVYSGFSIGGRVKQMDGNEITGLTLSEISLVDRPANPDAKFDVFKADVDEDLDKRDFSTKERKALASSGKALPDGSFPIETVQDLKNAIRAIGRAKDPEKAKAHIKARARALGATDLIPDSWKADTEEDIQKNAYHGANVADMAANMRGMIDYKKTQGHPTGHLEDALEALKLAATRELGQNEDYNNSSNPGMPMNMADTEEDLKKEDVTETAEKPNSPEEDVIETSEVEEKPETDANMEAKEAGIEEKEEEIEGDKEVADQPTDINKVMGELLTAGKMPTDEQITEFLKIGDQIPTDDAIKIFRFEWAGKIFKYIDSHRELWANADAEIAKAKKVMDETPVIQGDFKKLIDLLDKFETQYKEINKEEGAVYTPSEIKTPAPSVESPKSPATQINDALNALNFAVKVLSQYSSVGVLTGDEEAELENGVNAGSERTSTGRFNEENEVNNSSEENSLEAKGSQKKADLDLNLNKVETLNKKVADLEEKIAKLESQPMPIKAVAGYATVEKFDTNNKKADLDQVLKKADEVSELLKIKPFDPELQKQAQSLQVEIMRLRRETNGSSN